MEFITLVPIVTSVLALASSLYLWVLQRQRESARLRSYWSGQGMLWSFRNGDTDADIGIGMDVRLLIANLSALPDAILGAKVWVYSNEQRTWLPCHYSQPAAYERSETPLFPLNLAPRSTQGLHLQLVCSVPLSVIGGHEIMSEASYEKAQAYLNPLRFRVELIGLDGRHHRSEFTAVRAE